MPQNWNRKSASTSGVEPDQFVLESVTARLVQTRVQAPTQHLSPVEGYLLKQINQSFSHIPWNRYHELIAKRENETLSSEDHQERIQISDEIEEANVLRLSSVAQLAEIRGITILALMKSLGITQIDHG